MTHEERMHELLYSNDGRVEQCERICKLEDIINGMLLTFRLGADKCGISREACRTAYETCKKRMREVGNA